MIWKSGRGGNRDSSDKVRRDERSEDGARQDKAKKGFKEPLAHFDLLNTLTWSPKLALSRNESDGTLSEPAISHGDELAARIILITELMVR